MHSNMKWPGDRSMFDHILFLYVVYFNIFIAIYLVIYTAFLMINMIYGALHILRSVRLERLHNVLEHDFFIRSPS